MYIQVSFCLKGNLGRGHNGSLTRSGSSNRSIATIKSRIINSVLEGWPVRPMVCHRGAHYVQNLDAALSRRYDDDLGRVVECSCRAFTSRLHVLPKLANIRNEIKCGMWCSHVSFHWRIYRQFVAPECFFLEFQSSNFLLTIDRSLLLEEMQSMTSVSGVDGDRFCGSSYSVFRFCRAGVRNISCTYRSLYVFVCLRLSCGALSLAYGNLLMTSSYKSILGFA